MGCRGAEGPRGTSRTMSWGRVQEGPCCGAHRAPCHGALGYRGPTPCCAETQKPNTRVGSAPRYGCGVTHHRSSLQKIFPPPFSDVDECSNGTLCGAHATCHNLPGSFQCACDPGYETARHGHHCVGTAGGPGTGGTTPRTTMTPGDTLPRPNLILFPADVDECETLRGVCGAERCENVEGSFLCLCPDSRDEFDPVTGRCVPPPAPQTPPQPPGTAACFSKACGVLAPNVTQQQCCCSLGWAWGTQCPAQPCPTPGTGRTPLDPLLNTPKPPHPPGVQPPQLGCSSLGVGVLVVSWVWGGGEGRRGCVGRDWGAQAGVWVYGQGMGCVGRGRGVWAGDGVYRQRTGCTGRGWGVRAGPILVTTSSVPPPRRSPCRLPARAWPSPHQPPRLASR